MRCRLLLPLWFLGACVRTPEPPVPREVAPSWAFSGEDTRVDVYGDGLLPMLRVTAGAAGGSDLDDDFEVRLRPVSDPDAAGEPLVGVNYQGLGHLSAVVPEGLIAADYDVVVVTPAGATGVGEGLFTVRDTLVDRVVLGIDAVTHEVFSEAEVSVSLEDPSGDAVPEDLEIDVVIEGQGLVAEDLALRTTGLDHVVALEPPALGVRGRLGADGVAQVFPQLKVAGEYTVRVAPSDPASRVHDDDVVLDWARGSVLSVRVDLPTADFVAQAGESFNATLTVIDQFGVPAPDASISVAVTDACASWGLGVRVDGSAAIIVRPTVATGSGRCVLDRLVVVGAGVTGQSAPFEVRPGPHMGFNVLASPSSLTAGTTLGVFVTPVDFWGNVTTWSGVVSTLDDGGGVASFGCVPGAVVVCTAVVTRAGTERKITASDGNGHSGTSNPFTVLPAAPARVQVTPASTSWVAGAPTSLALGLFDAFENPVSGSTIDLTDTHVDDPSHEASCTSESGQIVCTLFTASAATKLIADAAVVRADLSRTRLVGETAALVVVNGELASVAVVPDAASVRAGVPLLVSLAGRDAWANPYVVQSRADVRLTDASDTLSPRDVQLGADGTASTLVTLTRAGRTTLRVSRDAALLGVSPPIDVDPASPVRLDVAVDVPWTFVGDAVGLRIQALDVYGNRARHDESVDVRSVGHRAGTQSLPMFNGLAVGVVTWVSSADSDTLSSASLEGGGLSGLSAPIVIARHCANGPTVVASVGLGNSGLVCTDAAGAANVALSFAGATASSGQTLTLFGAVETGGQVQTSTLPSLAVPTSRVGRHDLRLLAVQSDGCGTEVNDTAWTGPDDGSAVGPLAVAVTPSQLHLDSPVATTAVVSGARTCRGDVASQARVSVRTSRGRLLGLTPSGRGLSLQLDTQGVGSAMLDLGAAVTGGVGGVTAWTDAAVGVGTFVVAGDHQRPEVWTQDPKGPVNTSANKLTVWFSEPIDPNTLPLSSMAVLGPQTVSVTDITAFDQGRAVEITLSAPVGPSATGWVLLVADDVADLAGNHLGGSWSGDQSVYEGPFGVPDPTDPMTSCTLDTETFAPDGDPGLGVQADTVAFAFASNSSPAWWVLSIEDASGALLRHHHLPPTARVGQWTWDGRDGAGAVVPTGRYTLTVDAEGARGGLGGPCSRDVDVLLGGP